MPPPSKTPHPPGVVSSWFADEVKPGDILDVKAPAGHFALDLQRSRPLVLIGGGVGITPVLSMANALSNSGLTLETWFFVGMRNSRDHILKKECEELAARSPWLRLQVCYSQPLPEDIKGRDYQHESRVTVDLLKATLPSANYDYHLCGPGAFMDSLTDGLEAWGVPAARHEAACASGSIAILAAMFMIAHRDHVLPMTLVGVVSGDGGRVFSRISLSFHRSIGASARLIHKVVKPCQAAPMASQQLEETNRISEAGRPSAAGPIA